MSACRASHKTRYTIAPLKIIRSTYWQAHFFTYFLIVLPYLHFLNMFLAYDYILDSQKDIVLK